MKIVQVQFSPWDKVYGFSLPEEIKATVGDFVIVDTELGRELGKIVAFSAEAPSEHELKPVLSLATLEDARSVYDEDRIRRALETCQDMVARHGLEMK